MAAQIAAVGKHHSPGDVGCAAIELAVDEVCEAAEEQTDRGGGGDQIAECQNHDALLAGVQDGRDDDGRALASGVYVYRLRTDEGQQETRKLLLIR